jgi:hypothetical protein
MSTGGSAEVVMATKTVVCPECGASAAPGRYACAECGTLLASVAVTARSWSGAADEGDEAGPDDRAADPEPATPGAPALAPDAQADLVDETAVGADAGTADPVAPGPDGVSPGADPSAFDEDAPLGSVGEIDHAVTDVRHNVPDAGDPADAAVEASESPVAATSPVTAGWPPSGDLGPVARPEPRTPAGSYLPPSAVLPPMDGGAGAPGAAIATTAPPIGAGPAGAPDRGAGADWADRGSAAIAGALDRVRVNADGSRGAIAIGAGLAAIGVLLPRVDGLAGQSPFAGYLDRWFLAVPGMWLVLLGLVGLTVIASSSGRVASWPIGLPAIATAAFIGGLLWPYLTGGFGGAIGIWVMLVGAIVLVIGGVLDRGARRERHGGAQPSVPTDDGGGR